jgi:hypothetical protein
VSFPLPVLMWGHAGMTDNGSNALATQSSGQRAAAAGEDPTVTDSPSAWDLLAILTTKSLSWPVPTASATDGPLDVHLTSLGLQEKRLLSEHPASYHPRAPETSKKPL